MILRSRLLEDLPWIDHGFGTRHAPLSQEHMASLRQIHSNIVVVRSLESGCEGEGDALISNRAGAAISVRTADCFPILLADSRHRAVAAIHAGWRGTAAAIVLATLRRMESEYETNPQDVSAAIGPGIGVCCYEVGADVARTFGVDGVTHLDLAEQNRRQLIAGGVDQGRIEVVPGCTRCDAERFHSFRRDRQNAGRMISYICPR